MLVVDIVARVREYLDEVEAVNGILKEYGSAPVTERIKALIPECAIHYMDGVSMGEKERNSFTVDATGVATMDVPSDWGRLYELRLNCWRRSVYATIEADSPQYRRQQQLVTRGGITRPVVAIVPYGEGRRLEMYSVPVWDSRVEIERATYVPLPTVADDNTDISIAQDKEVAMCYMIAVRVCRTYGKERAAELLRASLSEELNILKQRLI